MILATGRGNIRAREGGNQFGAFRSDVVAWNGTPCGLNAAPPISAKSKLALLTTAFSGKFIGTTVP
jgi:hypothetical protein